MIDDYVDDMLAASDVQRCKDREQRRNELGPLDQRDEATIQQAIEVLAQAQILPDILVSNRLHIVIEKRIAEQDRILSAQLDLIMHHPDFQHLEASWRGLYFLVHEEIRSHEFANWESVKFRVINVSKKDLLKELERAVEFDQSGLFYRVHDNVYGTFEDPFCCLIGDYAFGRNPQDVSLLEYMSHIAAAAHAPFIASAAPEMFGLATFADIGLPRDLGRIFDGNEYSEWMRFRESEDSRYVALTLPHILLRSPYGIGEDEPLNAAFGYQEDVTGKDRGKYLWGNAAFALATRITEAYAEYGWLARIFSEKEGDPMQWSMSLESGGGLVRGLPTLMFKYGQEDLERQSPLEGWITDRREYELQKLGFIAPQVYNGHAVFLGSQSCQKPKQHDNPVASLNAILSSQIRYILCGSLLARNLLAMVRDWPLFEAPIPRDECEMWMNTWINQYVVAGPEMASLEQLAKRPLREARVEVRETQSGCYEAVLQLRPNFQSREFSASLRFVMMLPPGKLKKEEKELEQVHSEQGWEHLPSESRKRWWQFWK